MKKVFYSFSFLTLLFIVSSCSSSESNENNSCDRSNWYGTFDKISEICDNGGDPVFEDIAFWKEGPCDNCIADMSNTEYRINEDCKVVYVTPLNWEVLIELDNDIISVEIASFDCKAIYKRRE